MFYRRGFKLGKAGLWLVDRYRNFRRFCKRAPVSAERIRRARKLYPSKIPEEILRRQDGKRVSEIGMILLIGSLLYGGALWFGKEQEMVSVLERPGYGEKEITYELEVQREDGIRLPIDVTMPEQVLNRGEAEKRLEEAYEEICQRMLGENESISHVDQDLRLPEKALGGLVRAEWSSKSKEVFNDWGELIKTPEERPAEGEIGIYELCLSCGEYGCQYEIEVIVYPPERTDEAKFLDALELEMEKEVEGKEQKEIFVLPETYKGEKLTWFWKEKEGINLWIFVLLAAGCIFLGARGRQQEREKLKEREREMLMDYPELISKFTVLLQAGLAARNVWERMVTEYEGQKKTGKKPRYAYEEMAITWNQMKNGMYESQAYGEFGRRCGLHTYMKFGALLEQNLRQGTTGLVDRLREEAALAFEERKNLARRLGEEAETRLMLPMFMMLFMVLTVIMVPAFLSF